MVGGVRTRHLPLRAKSGELKVLFPRSSLSLSYRGSSQQVGWLVPRRHRSSPRHRRSVFRAGFVPRPTASPAMNRKAGRTDGVEDAVSSGRVEKHEGGVRSRGAWQVRYGAASGSAVAVLCAVWLHAGLGLRWQQALLVYLCVGSCGVWTALVCLRVVSSRKAVFTVTASTVVVVLALLALATPFMPSFALLARGTRATVYNTMPCHFKEAAQYFNDHYWQMLTGAEAWRSCVVPVTLFDALDGSLRRPNGQAVKLARAHAIRKLKNLKLRAWLENRSLARGADPPRPLQKDPRINVTCPSSGNKAKILQSGAEVGSYVDRGTERCMSITGVWCCSTLCESFCKIASVATLLGYRSGDVVFDWGAGCGHMLGWLERTFGVMSTGHEYHAALHEYAYRHTHAAKLCSGDGKTLAHLPDAYVDHIVSNAALYHLAPKDQCKIMLGDFLRILRPGGTVWIGWSGSEDDGEMHGQIRFSRHEWEKCLEGVGGAILYETFLEGDFFGTSEYLRKQTFSVLVAKM